MNEFFVPRYTGFADTPSYLDAYAITGERLAGPHGAEPHHHQPRRSGDSRRRPRAPRASGRAHDRADRTRRALWLHHGLAPAQLDRRAPGSTVPTGETCMKFLKYTLLCTAILIGGLALAWKLAEPAPLPAGSAGAALMAQPPWSVGMRKFDLVDSSRPTDANGDFPGAPERTLHARAWYPLDAVGGSIPARAFPLIVYSHGFFSTSAEPAYLARLSRQPRLRGRRGRFPAHQHEGTGRGQRIRRGQPARRRELPDRHAAGVERRSRERRSTRRIDAARIGIAGPRSAA